MQANAQQWDSFLARIAETKTLPELEAIDLEIFGRKQGALTEALKALGAASPDERKEQGRVLNDWKNRLASELEARKIQLQSSGFSSLREADALDPTLTLPEKQRGHLHLIPEFIRRVENVFGRMGFDVAEGNEIETDEFNFTLLNIPEDHPARDMQDTFWIAGDDKRVLRTHTSPVQVHYMHTHKPPFRMICPGKVYRKDYDATHSPMFHQFEGLMVGEDVSLTNMKAVMVAAMKELLSDDIEFRFRTSYFQFVEPGLEVDIRWRGKEETKEGRWLEVVGCGMVHPNVLRNGGVDPEKYRGFAFGFGVERLLMIKHAVPDLRSFYEGDVRFLRQF
jgi:phenylalanyl-tRNA synthetase alpha chain